MSFEELRAATLQNLKLAADTMREMEESKMESLQVVFQREDSKSEFPYWNLINGPIADAIWHTGQIVSFRRASGNPFNSRASVFSGKLREFKK